MKHAYFYEEVGERNLFDCIFLHYLRNRILPLDSSLQINLLYKMTAVTIRKSGSRGLHFEVYSSQYSGKSFLFCHSCCAQKDWCSSVLTLNDIAGGGCGHSWDMAVAIIILGILPRLFLTKKMYFFSDFFPLLFK